MYTEFVFAIELKEETPKNVIKILKYMVDELDGECITYLPKHEFFETEKWSMLFTSDTNYFRGITSSILRFDNVSKTYFLTTRSSLKNYNQEIEKFLNWIKPYIESYGHQFLGYKMHEEDEEPTLIYFDSLDITNREIINNKKLDKKRYLKIPLFSENKIINIIIQIIFCVFICFSTTSLISDNQIIFDITKILFIIVVVYICFKATKGIFNDIKK